LEPAGEIGQSIVASLQAALKNAIRVQYQLEDNELAVEPLPDPDNRRMILFYESAEGGAGVLRRLVDEPQALSSVAKEALRICHFDPETGEDSRRAPAATEDCEAACYDCLMSYSNQRDHRLLDRQSIREILLSLSSAKVHASPTILPRAEQLQRLKNLSQSTLERKWLDYLEQRNLNLPSEGHVFIEACKTRPDFVYKKHSVVVYIDGPVHDYSDREERDNKQTECMEDLGYTVIRFGHEDDWTDIISKYPSIFGRLT